MNNNKMGTLLTLAGFWCGFDRGAFLPAASKPTPVTTAKRCANVSHSDSGCHTGNHVRASKGHLHCGDAFSCQQACTASCQYF